MIKKNHCAEGPDGDPSSAPRPPSRKRFACTGDSRDCLDVFSKRPVDGDFDEDDLTDTVEFCISEGESFCVVTLGCDELEAAARHMLAVVAYTRAKVAEVQRERGEPYCAEWIKSVSAEVEKAEAYIDAEKREKLLFERIRDTYANLRGDKC